MGQPVVHFEVIGKDGERTRDYYSELFGWEINADNPPKYGIVDREQNLNPDGIGIGGGVGAGPDGYDGHATFYVEVPDVEAALAKAEELGGSRMMGPEKPMEGVEIGIFQDLDGNPVGVVERVTDGLAIEASGLVKSFGETRAVDGVDLAVRRGSVYGVLGPNGAGKTTTIRMLATLIRPDEGSARVLGHDIVDEGDAVRGAVTLTGQLASVDEDLTGDENLILVGRLLGLKRAEAKARSAELLEAFGLSEAAGRLVKNYSGGMRRRLDLAASIVVTPQLMFLDEPTTGLDPRSRNQVWEIIRLLVAEGTTILLCTQYLEEADQLCDGIAVIDHGKVIAEGTPAQLKASVGSGALRVRLLDPEQRPEAERLLTRELGTVHLEPDPAALSVACADADRAAGAVAELSRSNVRVANFSVGQPSLDEVFLALTGHVAEHDEEEQAA